MFPKLFLLAAACLLVTRGAAAQLVSELPTAYPVAAPPAVTPAALATMSPQLELLHQKIAQRDQLQREIDQLIIETQTPQVIELHLELLEINVATAEELGIDLSTLTPPQVEELRRQGATQTVLNPKFMTSSGEQLNSHLGEEKKIQCRADSLGNNRVHLALHVAAKTNAELNDAAGATSPQGTTLAFDTRLECNFSEPRILSGLRLKRTQTRRGALGRVTESITTQAVLIVRAEPVLPQAVGVVPAAAFTPR